MTTKQVGDKLVALCREGKFREAIEQLYSPDIVSVEPVGDETMPATMIGLQAVLGKADWWIANHEVHRMQAQGPFPHGERFAVLFDMEVTPKAGPMAGQRMAMQEVALYSVTAGKISREEFFYSMEA